MKRILSLVATCILVLVGLSLAPAPGRAQVAPTMVTTTFRLTIIGTPPTSDSFAITWGETGIELCSAPCAGAGHTYQKTMLFPTGVTETFVFTRGGGTVTPGKPGQKFGSQRVTMSRDRTVSAVFTYASASVSTPSAGAAIPVLYGAPLAGSGAALCMLLFVRRHRPGEGRSASLLSRPKGRRAC
jgi:hypothetical protein